MPRFGVVTTNGYLTCEFDDGWTLVRRLAGMGV